MAPSQPDNTDRHVLAEGRHVRFVRQAGWEWAERVEVSGVVTVVALTAERRLVLTEQYRRPVDARVLDLPAGLAGDEAGAAGETLLAAAQRELMEETGYAASAWEFLAEGPSSPGMTNEILTFFLARNAVQMGPGGGDASEAIEVHAIPLGQLSQWLAGRREAGVLVDLKVYCGAYFASRVP